MSEGNLLSTYQKQRRRIRREVEKRLGPQLARYGRTVSEIVGEPLPSASIFPKGETNSIFDRMDAIATAAISTFDADWRGLSPEEGKKRLREFFDNLLGQFYDAPKGERLVRLRNELDEILRPRFDNAYQSSFYGVSEAAGWLIDQLFRRDRASEAQTFFSRFVKTQEAFSLAQIYVQSLLPATRRIDNLERKELGKREIQSLVRDYEVMAGVYEKLCRIIVVLNRIRLGEMADYDDVRRSRLASVLNVIEQEPELRPIADKVSTRIRNSIAHPSYRVYFSRKRIRFDPELDLTWSEFRRSATQLSVAIASLTFMPFLHFLKGLLNLFDQWTG